MIVELKFKEHYFTSSKYKGGFFTLDNSPDLRKEEIVELEKKGLYNPAIKLPSSPSESEIEQLFPVNQSFFRLKSSGRYVFLHSKYTGKTNHSIDRYGNFFSHSLILCEGEPSFPVKFIFDKAKTIFKESFNLDEDTSYAPRLNTDPSISFENSDFTNEELFRHFQKFLISDTSRLNTMARVFDLILEGKISRPGYNITICDKKENLTELILGVNYFLPRLLANRVSFATYVDNPDSTNYPFEITGVIPECGIERLPEQYFNLVTTTTLSGYNPVQSYSKLLLEIISFGQYGDWKNLLKEVEEFEVIELNQKLNAPASFIAFKTNIHNRKGTVSEFKTLLSQVTASKADELKDFTIKNNSALFLEYVLSEVDKITSDNFSSVSKKFDSFLVLYREYFEGSSFFNEDLFFQFVESFRDKFSGLEKSKVSLFILSNLNCLHPPLKNINDVFESADLFFDDEAISFEEKLSAIQGLFKYKIRDNQNDKIRSIMSYKKYDELKALAIKGSLYSHWGKYKADLLNLKEGDRISLLILCFNPTLTKGEYHKYFQNMLAMVETVLPENQKLFWQKFFDRNNNYNKENSLNYCSLNYLKRKFVSYLFLKNINKIEVILETQFDEQSVKWIQEDIIEQTTNPDLIEKFNHMFKNLLVPKRTWL